MLMLLQGLLSICESPVVIAEVILLDEELTNIISALVFPKVYKANTCDGAVMINATTTPLPMFHLV